MGHPSLTHAYLYPDGHAVLCYRETHRGVEIRYVEIHEKWLTGGASVPQWNAGTGPDGQWHGATGRILLSNGGIVGLGRKATSLHIYLDNSSAAMKDRGLSKQTMGIGIKGYGEISIDGPLLAHGQEVCGGDFLVQSGKEYHATWEQHATLRHWGDCDTGVHKIHRLKKIEGKVY